MEPVFLLVLAASAFVAYNIGANDSSNAVGTVVGASTVRYRTAILLVSFFALTGALLQSHENSKTVGGRIIPSSAFAEDSRLLLAVLVSASIIVLAFTLLATPVSTSQALVGSVAGAAVALGYSKGAAGGVLLKIVASWIAAPFVSCILAMLIYFKLVSPLARRLGIISFNQVFRILMFFGAAFISYNIGANGLGNALGPLVAHSGGLHASPAIILAMALALCLGAFTLGHRVTETLGKKITSLGPATGFTAQLASAVTVYSFVLMGIPVSTTQAIVGGIAGVGLTKGAATVNARLLGKIFFGWISTPLLAACGSILLYNFLQIL